MRIAIFAPHFAEYSLRLALGHAETEPVLLIVHDRNLEQEVESSMVEAARKRLRLVAFGIRGPHRRFLARLKIIWAVLRFRPDILHVQEQTDPLTVSVVRWLSLFYPVFLTVHDPKPHLGKDADWARRMTPYRERLRAIARGFHVHGAHCMRELRSALGAERPIFSTQHGLILVPSKQRRQEPIRRRILMFGRMEAYKGLELLLDACAHLDRRGVEYTLLLAGRGPELDRLADRLSGMQNIEVISRFLSVDEAIGEFQKAAFAVMPYLEATQSGVIAAAFANGRPVVATAVGGLVDAVDSGRNGLLVAPNDPASLAAGMEQLLTDETTWNNLRQGVEAGLPEFEWREICSRLRTAYQAIAALHQPGQRNQHS